MAFSDPSDDIERQDPGKGGAMGFAAGEDVTRGQVVKLSSDNTVVPSDTDGENVIGIATQTVSSGSGQLQVTGNGARVLFTAGSGDVSAGDNLASFGGTSDEGTVNVASNTGDFIVGQALEGAASPGSTFVGIVDTGGEVN